MKLPRDMDAPELIKALERAGYRDSLGKLTHALHEVGGQYRRTA